MKFGVVSPNSEVGIMPDALARELEARGFESMWVPEHTHIPVSRETPFPTGTDLPPAYVHMMSSLVSLTAAAAVTERLVVGTCVCLLLQHDLIDLALQAATLDVISNGRLRMGIGTGWNVEEFANHRPDVPFKKRYSAMRERVAALRTIWRDDVAAFDGEWDRLTPSWVYPKPLARQVPIYMGGSAPLAMAHAASYADHWMPIDDFLADDEGKPDVGAGIARFKRLLEQEGRDSDSVGISLFLFNRPTAETIERYAALGIERLILAQAENRLLSRDDSLQFLDDFTPVVDRYR